jgi:biotin carboxylase
MTDEGVVLLIGSGVQRYREYLLAGAARGRRIWLIDAAESTWQKPYVVGTTVVPLLNPARLTPNKEALIEAALEVAKHERVVGVFSYDEVLIVTTAHIADRLGLPGSTIDGVENCRNKARNRAVLTAAGLPQPRFEMVRTLEEARAAAEATGYPLVLKPQGMGASIGVIRVDGPGELADAFAMSLKSSYGGNPTYEGGVLVEEMLVGPEISIDGAVFDGEYIPLFLARKSVGLPPFFEEVGHVVDPADPLLADREFLDVLSRAHRAAKFEYGMTHTEVMLTKRGPAIVEINGRLGGDLIPYLGQLATGIDPGAVAADVASGIRPNVTPDKNRVIGIRFAYPPEDCRVVEISVPEPGSLPGLLESAAMVPPGRELRLPPNGYLGRFAYAIATADTPRECAARLDAAVAQAHLKFEAPQADPGELFTR